MSEGPSPLSTGVSPGLHDMVRASGCPGAVQVRVLPLTDGSSPGLQDMVLGIGWPGVVQFILLPSVLGAPCSPSLHDMVLSTGWPGVVQVRVLPLTDGSSPGLQDMVLGIGWSGVVQNQTATVNTLDTPCSPSLHDMVWGNWLAWCSTSKSATSCIYFCSFIT